MGATIYEQLMTILCAAQSLNVTTLSSLALWNSSSPTQLSNCPFQKVRNIPHDTPLLSVLCHVVFTGEVLCGCCTHKWTSTNTSHLHPVIPIAIRWWGTVPDFTHPLNSVEKEPSSLLFYFLLLFVGSWVWTQSGTLQTEPHPAAHFALFFLYGLILVCLLYSCHDRCMPPHLDCGWHGVSLTFYLDWSWISILWSPLPE
jgi:hypothetical protein